MRITLGDGKAKEVTPALQSAFTAWAKGEATPSQQKLCLAYTLHEICGLLNIPSINATERASGFADGARWAGNTIAQLCGGPVAVLKLGETSDGHASP